MPPRYAYWTILIGDEPTAFRAGAKEELLPTLNRLQAKHPEARLMWWQNGKLWDSRIDAQEAMRARGEIGRRNDSRQSDRPRPSFRDRPRSSSSQDFRTSRPQGFKASRQDPKPEWKPKPQGPRPKPSESGKLDWKPKGEFTPAEKRERKTEKPDWEPKASRPQGFKASKPEWKSRSSEKPEWKPKASRHQDFKTTSKPEWSPKPQAPRPASPKRDSATAGPKPFGERRSPRAKLDWTPKSGYTDKADRPATEKRQWVPKAEYKKSLGIEPKKDAKWRPGGEHRDPKQKYKDAKKAKWTQFKQTIRKRWEAKGGKKEK